MLGGGAGRGGSCMPCVIWLYSCVEIVEEVSELRLRWKMQLRICATVLKKKLNMAVLRRVYAPSYDHFSAFGCLFVT